MNTKNNKRRQETIQKIESVFYDLIQTKELSQITVSEICKLCDKNRRTFYSNFIDVYDLADNMKEKLEQQVALLYAHDYKNERNSNDYLRLFRHIYENQVLYSTFFKLGYDNNYPITLYDTDIAQKRFNNRFIDYHIEFFMNGLNAIIKKWLRSGCNETPEEMM